VSSLLKRLMLLYLTLLLILAALGAHNQALHAERLALLNLKAQRELERVELRGRSAVITGPMAVRAWALSRGMVPVPQLSEAATVMKLNPPVMAVPKTGLEIVTVWR
jgi:hypothetical protein